jgi:hypothetical protein
MRWFYNGKDSGKIMMHVKPLMYASIVIMELGLLLASLVNAQERSNIQGWKITCKNDPIHDIRTCHGIKGDLIVLLQRSGRLNIDVVGSDDQYPGSHVYVRVDRRKPHSAGEGGWSNADAWRIVDELKTGKIAITRYTNWPHNRLIDTEISLDGFNEMMQTLQRRAQHK